MSRPNVFVDIFERIERAAAKLPSPLQDPVLRELAPVKELFLMRRPPRMAVSAPNPAIWARAVNLLAGRTLISETLAQTVDIAQHWVPVRDSQTGTLDLVAAGSLSMPEADLLLVVVDAADGDSARSARQVARRALVPAQMPPTPPAAGRTRPLSVLAIVLAADGRDAIRAQTHLNEALRTETGADARLVATVILSDPVAQQPSPGSPETPQATPQAFDGSRASVAALIVRELPMPAQLEGARLFSAREAQEEICHTLIKSVSALAGFIGAQPLPLADFPVLLTLQSGMVLGVAHISGEQPNARLLARFLAAMGFNFAAAILLREGARGLSKLLPGWGQAVGGGVAAMGTYGIGSAARAHFLRGAGLSETRALLRRSFHRLRPHDTPVHPTACGGK